MLCKRDVLFRLFRLVLCAKLEQCLCILWGFSCNYDFPGFRVFRVCALNLCV